MESNYNCKGKPTRSQMQPITTFELWRMPEFRAFCEAVGIELYLPIPGDESRSGSGTIIEIPFNLNGLVTVTQTYQCRPGHRDKIKADTESSAKENKEEKAYQCKPVHGDKVFVPSETTTTHNKNSRTYKPSEPQIIIYDHSPPECEHYNSE